MEIDNLVRRAAEDACQVERTVADAGFLAGSGRRNGRIEGQPDGRGGRRIARRTKGCTEGKDGQTDGRMNWMTG